MKKIAKFEKVSFEQYKKDLEKSVFKATNFDIANDLIMMSYESIQLPRRATKGSAGYDFFMPNCIGGMLKENGTVTIPTGIRVRIEDGWVLKLYPRSGLGFKYGVGMSNTVGIIDSDYYFADNEGHIHCKLTTKKDVDLEDGKAFMQGIFVEYGITEDDNADGERIGGFGSTDKNKSE